MLLVPSPRGADDRIEAVLHCAARSLVSESIREPALYYAENVVGGLALLWERSALQEEGPRSELTKDQA